MSTVDPVTGLKELLLGRVSAQLNKHGFRPLKPSGSLYRSRDDGLFDCISLLMDYGTEARDASLLCTVNVGIGYWDGNKDLGGRKCALTWNIGYLMSGRKWLEWDLCTPGDTEATIRQIIQCIESVAIPWLEKFETPSDVRREQSQNQPRGFGSLKRTAKRSWAS